MIFMWAWFVNKQAQSGHVLEMTGLLNESDFVPGILDAVKSGGKLWGGPYTGKIKPGFWYRKSFFKQHGLAVPTTWDEFVDLCARIKKIPGVRAPIASGNGVGWPLSDVTEHFIATFGGPAMTRDLIAGKMSWTDANWALFENRLVPLLKAGYFSEPIEWTMAADLWAGDYAVSWGAGSLNGERPRRPWGSPTRRPGWCSPPTTPSFRRTPSTLPRPGSCWRSSLPAARRCRSLRGATSLHMQARLSMRILQWIVESPLCSRVLRPCLTWTIRSAASGSRRSGISSSYSG